LILAIDNYDSFTFNLVQLLEVLGADVRVVRNDAIDVAGVLSSGATHLVISPGPCSPREAGVSVEAIRAARVPVLGVCLGHQAIGAAFGARVVRAPRPVHGMPAPIRHGGDGLFEGLPQGFLAARYHSLVVDGESLPEELVPTAFTDDGLVMALAHRTRPIVGVQFHPESVLTPDGTAIVRNFLALKC
jgi:anthranilate synthase component II